MNIVNKLTLRQLKLNKKRTLVTIIGTIISAAMITAVATLGLSFMDLMQRQSIAARGEWHAIYHEVDLKKLNIMKVSEGVKHIILSRQTGYTYLKGSQNENKPYLYISELNETGFKHFPVRIKEGRLPKKADEMVISEAVQSNAGVAYHIGDTIQLTIGQRVSTLKDNAEQKLMQETALQYQEGTEKEYLTEDFTKTYTIVGIIKRPDLEYTWSPGYTALTYMDETTVTPQEVFDVSVIFKKVNGKIFDKAEQLGKAAGISSMEYNNDLLRYYGVIKDDGVKKMLFGLSAVIMVIIVIGSVSLIYNAFAISVSERSRYLGMLSSVGATRRQKRNSVFFEGAVIGVISIPLGIISGYAGLGITYIFINPILLKVLNVTQGFRLRVYPSSLITSILVAGVTILISTYIPARRASNVSAIDAIRQVTDYKIKGKQVRTLKFTRRIFGIEGDLGLKNLKRNKRRYMATVFSLVISMVLFLVVSSFNMYIKKSLVMTQDGINFDIQATIRTDNEEEKKKILQEIISLDYIKDYSELTTLDTTAMIDEKDIADYLKDGEEEYLQQGKYPYQIIINVLQDDQLKAYAKAVGADINQLMSIDSIHAIVIDSIKYKDYKKDMYIETKAIKTSIGSELKLSYLNSKTAKEKELPPIKVAALTEARPMGVMPLGGKAAFHIVMSQKSFEKLLENVNRSEIFFGIKTLAYFNSNKPLGLQAKLESIQSEYGMSKLNIFNVYYYKQQEEQALLLVSVFTYAFILLITAICIANIINTISTSIALRKREFAMLKSVGITPKGFNKMLNYESIFYGLKALLYGLPISYGAMYLMYRLLMMNFNYPFIVPVTSICIVVAAVFIIVGLAMLYSGAKVKKENIIDALKQEIA